MCRGRRSARHRAAAKGSRARGACAQIYANNGCGRLPTLAAASPPALGPEPRRGFSEDVQGESMEAIAVNPAKVETATERDAFRLRIKRSAQRPVRSSS